MSRRRLRMLLGSDDPWVRIDRSGPGGGPAPGDDTWAYVAWAIIAIIILAVLLS